MQKNNTLDKRVALFFSHDSFFKGSKPLVDALESKDFKVDLYQLLKDNTEDQNSVFKTDYKLKIVKVLYDDLEETLLKQHENFQVFYLNLPGNYLNFFYKTYENVLSITNTKKRALLVGGFNGLLSYRKLKGFYARTFLDIFHLNAQDDHDFFLSLVDSFEVGFKPKLICSGIPILDWAKSITVEPDSYGPIVFIGQTSVPSRLWDRLAVVDRLCDVAKSFPENKVIIKPRVQKNETAFHAVNFHYEDLLKQVGGWREVPKNLSVSYGNTEELVKKASLVISISSTVLLEAACLKIPILSISDFGVTPELGNTFFIGSGVLGEFRKLVQSKASPTLDAVFFQKNIFVRKSSSTYIADEIYESLESVNLTKPLGKSVFQQINSNREMYEQRHRSKERSTVVIILRFFKPILINRFSNYFLKKSLKMYRKIKNL